jgi:hypothetical protein
MASNLMQNDSKAEQDIKKLFKNGFKFELGGNYEKSKEFSTGMYGRFDAGTDASLKKALSDDGGSISKINSARVTTVYSRPSNRLYNIILSSESKENFKKSGQNLNEFNKNLKLSEFTLRSYFDIKKSDDYSSGKINVDLDKSSISYNKGILAVKDGSGKLIKAEYKFNMIPGRYQKNENGEKIAKDGKKIADVSIGGKKIISFDASYNWEKVRAYCAKRDFTDSLDPEPANYGKNIPQKIELHHMTELSQGGRDNLSNYIMLSQKDHKRVHSGSLKLNTAAQALKEEKMSFRELDDEWITKAERNKRINANAALEKSLEVKDKDRDFLNTLKSTIENNSAMRLTDVSADEKSYDLKFIDWKTKEEFKMRVSGGLTNEEKLIAASSVKSFTNEFTSSINNSLNRRNENENQVGRKPENIASNDGAKSYGDKYINRKNETNRRNNRNSIGM